MKKFIIILSVFLMINLSTYAKEASSFSDIDSSHWAYEAINKMVQSRIVIGYNDGTFKPDKEITRAEFAKIFAKSMDIDSEIEEPGYYNIVPGVDYSHWAYDYILSTCRYIPYEDTFRPDEYITREDTAYALVERLQLSNNKRDSLEQFLDANEISENKRENMSLAISNGIMNGFGNGTLNPKGNLTRAQVCTLIYNIKYKLNLYKKYLRFGEIVKEIRFKINVNGKNENVVNCIVTFNIDSIKEIKGYVIDYKANNYLDSKIEYGIAENGSYKGLPTATIIFNADKNNSDYRIFLYGLKTENGESTYGVNSLLLYSPAVDVTLNYDGIINSNSEIKLNWKENSKYFLVWGTMDKKFWTVIEDDKLSINDVVNVLKERYNAADILITAYVSKPYYDCSLVYDFNIYGIEIK